MLERSGTFTTVELLEALLVREESAAWERFDERYRPLLSGVLRRMGLGRDDAEDLAQEVLVRFLESHRSGRFDAARQRLRGWLLTTARSRTIDHLRKRAPVAQRDSLLAQVPAEEEFAEAWDTERDARILKEAVDILRRSGGVKTSTLRVFEIVAIDGRSAEEAAHELGMRIGAVYVAKHRCLGRVRLIVEELMHSYEEGSAVGPRDDA